MQGGREKGGRGGGVCPSVEALDCKSGILGVPDFNLEEKQTEKRDGVSEERRDSIMSGKRRRGDEGTRGRGDSTAGEGRHSVTPPALHTSFSLSGTRSKCRTSVSPLWQ